MSLFVSGKGESEVAGFLMEKSSPIPLLRQGPGNAETTGRGGGSVRRGICRKSGESSR